MDTSTNNYVTPSTHDVEANSTKLPWLVSQRETVTLLTKLSDADEDKANKTLETTSDQDVKNMLERTHTKLSRYDFTSCQGVSGHFFILVHFCFDLAESILFRGSATTVFFCGMILLMALIVPLMAHKKKVADKVMHSFRRSLNATHRERALMIRLLRLFGGKSWTMKYVISTFFFLMMNFMFWGSLWLDGTLTKELNWGRNGVIFLVVHGFFTEAALISLFYIQDFWETLLIMPAVRILSLVKIFLQDLKEISNCVDNDAWEGEKSSEKTEEKILLAWKHVREELDDFNSTFGIIFGCVLTIGIIGLVVLSYVLTLPGVPIFFHILFLSNCFWFTVGPLYFGAELSSRTQTKWRAVIRRTAVGARWNRLSKLVNLEHQGSGDTFRFFNAIPVSYGVLVKTGGLIATIGVTAIQVWLVRGSISTPV